MNKLPKLTLCKEKCTDVKKDNHNCGACGVECPTGSTCSSGSCVCDNCPVAPLGGKCPNLNTDNHNCGACGVECPTGTFCKGGACLCQSCPVAPVDGKCPDLKTDNHNCGACGIECPAGTSCKDGTCLCNTCNVHPVNGLCPDLLTDAHNCGTCGNEVGQFVKGDETTNIDRPIAIQCGDGTHCEHGVCSCPTGQTLCNGVCKDTLNDPHNCGSCGNEVSRRGYHGCRVAK